MFVKHEISTEDGSPIELYEFILGGTPFRYTNAEQDFVYQSNEFLAAPVSRSKIVSTIDDKDSQVDVKLPGDNTFARLYIGVIPAEFPEVTIRQLHTNDIDAEAIFVFQGAVSTVGFGNNLSESSLACKPITSTSGRTVPRHTYQSLCNNSLYDPRCGELEADREEFVLCESVDGSRILTIGAGELSTEVDGHWSGGFIEFGSEFRTISVQPAGRIMTIDLPFLNDPTGSSIRILPGCNHIIGEDCLNKFGTSPATGGNTVNHTGYPQVGQKNPFEGLD